ncbi:MAG: hypothetical protein FGM14_12730 [Flavobacteriales bacterium]|nr:hypothetical protein [Flavobacteriales bacterium]
MENQAAIKDFLEKYKDLFWHIPKNKVKDVSLDVLVEYVINYGDYSCVKEMLEVVGIEKAAEIFYKNNKVSFDNPNKVVRNNYNDLNRNLFKLYFDKHAPRNS